MIYRATILAATAAEAEGLVAAVCDQWADRHTDWYARNPRKPDLLAPAGTANEPCGYHPLYYDEDTEPRGGQWVTSSGNRLQVWLPAAEEGLPPGSVIVVAEGRRHGIPWAEEVLAVLYDAYERGEVEVDQYLTQEPHWLPWETADDHEDHEAPAS